MRVLRRPASFVRDYEGARVDDALPWRAAEFIALDFEATGLDLRADEVISYGLVPIRAGRMLVGAQEYSLVRPSVPVPGASSRVHRIRNRDLNDAPPAIEVAEALIRSCTGRVLVAHAAWVEVAFLKRLFRLHGAHWRTPVVDTAALARGVGLAPRIASREPSLEALAMELGVPVHDPHHALGDALTTAQVFLVLAARLERARGGTLDVGALCNTTREFPLLVP